MPTESPDEAVDRLRGAIDLHCHSGPSVMERKLDHLDAAREAQASGMRAVLFKDDFYPVTPVVETLKRHEFRAGALELLSGVVLNNSVGGLNPYAVEHDLRLGGRMVWMPTVSAANHIRHLHRPAATSQRQMKRHRMLTVLDDMGHITDAVKSILDIIAEHDAVLATGHLHISEIWVLVTEARQRGVGRLLVNHPDRFTGATLADVRELAAMDVFIEQSAGAAEYGNRLRSFIEAATVGQTVLGSWPGMRPVDSYRASIRLCLDLGFTGDAVRQMVSLNAARLLGINPERKAA